MPNTKMPSRSLSFKLHEKKPIYYDARLDVSGYQTSTPFGSLMLMKADVDELRAVLEQGFPSNSKTAKMLAAIEKLVPLVHMLRRMATDRQPTGPINREQTLAL